VLGRVQGRRRLVPAGQGSPRNADADRGEQDGDDY
jgi:hypothetical protein